MLYRQKYGMFNLGMRVEHSAGVVSATLSNVNRKPGSPPFKPSDFMVNGIEAEKEEGFNSLESELLKWQK